MFVGAGGVPERRQPQRAESCPSQVPPPELWAATQIMVMLVLRWFFLRPWNPPQSLGCLCPNTAAWPQPWRLLPGPALLFPGTSPSPAPLLSKHPGSPGTTPSPGTGLCHLVGSGVHLPFSSVLGSR